MRSLFLVALIFVFTACSSSSNNDESAANPGSATDGGDGSSNSPTSQPPSMKIDLPEVSGNCLNVEKYFQRIRGLPSTTSVRKVTKSIGLRTTGNSLPRNFRLRLAAGNFQVVDTTTADSPDFLDLKQEDCSKAYFKAEGRNEAYTITRAKQDSVTLQDEWGGELTVTWKGLNKLQIDEVSNVGDLLCDPNSKARLTTTSEITWGTPEILTSTLPGDLVDADYLKQVIEATGYSASVYSESNQLVVDRLKELSATAVRGDLLQCY